MSVNVKKYLYKLLKKTKRFSAFETHIRVMIQPSSARKASSETQTDTQTDSGKWMKL